MGDHYGVFTYLWARNQLMSLLLAWTGAEALRLPGWRRKVPSADSGVPELKDDLPMAALLAVRSRTCQSHHNFNYFRNKFSIILGFEFCVNFVFRYLAELQTLLTR
jgi:hypothetical protein